MSASDRPPPPGTWKAARAVKSAIVSPIQQILAIEAASGVLLMVATAIALFLANSLWAHDFEALWHMPIGFSIGGHEFERSLHFWINDGLMTIFFFVVGLEIRREIFEGELQTFRRAALPLAAALGGMLVPAIIYVAFNAGKAGSAGWAIPMATDIAFAVGVLTLLGSRVPNTLRVLLLALAVIDDIGAIVIIAIFYSGGLELYGFGIAAVGLAGAFAMRAAGVRQPLLYLAPGLLVWAGMYIGGIHPTLAGVILGLATPVLPWFGPSGFAETTRTQLEGLDENDRHALLHRLDAINAARKEAVSPVERLIHALHPWVAFVIMPVFALANAGVSFGGADLSGDAFWIFVGIVAGLALGKPIGIAGMALLSSRVGIGSRPPEMKPNGVVLVGVVGGIGFTMSLFIAQLAFKDPALLDTAKLGILVGSACAMVIGLGLGRLLKKPA
ncbi:MAG: Na+/H+ antiporter NhaA [Kofleriaceae bacterium]